MPATLFAPAHTIRTDFAEPHRVGWAGSRSNGLAATGASATDDPAAAVALAGASSSPKTYTVASGDHLWAIAERTVRAAHLGSSELSVSRYWLRLVAANRDLVTDPDRIFPGQELLLPAIEVP